MKNCPLSNCCGGCVWRELNDTEYREQKETALRKILSRIKQNNIPWSEPVYIPDGTRRRAAMAFKYYKKDLQMGFNASQSHDIIDCHYCPLLTEKLNADLNNVRNLLKQLCAEPFTIKKGKKILKQNITAGDVFLCAADNGIDILLELNEAPTLNHRMIICEEVNKYPNIIRLSWRQSGQSVPETIIEKTRPLIKNSGIDVYIPAGTFLQASQMGEQALIKLVLKYVGSRTGKIADLFCGVGTFSYPLAQNKHNQILAVDSSAELLEGFKCSVNKNQLTNVRIETKNLFKYPLDVEELKNTDIVIFDPPRAGAAAQVKTLAAAQNVKVIIGVSCNPNTFVNDANTLIDGGYKLQELTMVDQFVYSRHTELVALFEKDEK